METTPYCPRKSSINPPTRKFQNKQIKKHNRPCSSSNNELSEKDGFISRTSNGAPCLPQGSLPWPGKGGGSSRVGRGGGPARRCSLCHRQKPLHRAGREGAGWGRQIRVQTCLHYSSGYFSELGQAAEVPRLRRAGVLKRGTSIHFFSECRPPPRLPLPKKQHHLLPVAPLLWRLSRSSTPFAAS